MSMSQQERLWKLLQTVPQDWSEHGGPSMDLAFSTAVDAAACGLAMYSNPADKLRPKVGPLTALPAPFPRNSLKMAKHLSPLMSCLMTVVAQDKKWIYSALKAGGVLSSDSFIAQLATIMMETEDPCPISTILFRHDFMLHAPNPEENMVGPNGYIPMRNVEMNTVSIGLSYLSDKTRQIHMRNMNRLMNVGAWPKVGVPTDTLFDTDGTACCDFAHAIKESLGRCKELKVNQQTDHTQAILMVTENVETNSIDQFGLWGCLGGNCFPDCDGSNSKYPTPSQRTLDYLVKAHIDGRLYRDENDVLLLREPDVEGTLVTKEISLIYWRVFYHPRHLESFDESEMFAFRRMIEGSKAIKVPSVAAQLAGTKEVQKRLSDRDTLARFLRKDYFNNDLSIQESMIQHLLDNTAVQIDPLADAQLLEQVMTTRKEHWVLKPQREGGGNNLFGDAMVARLAELKANSKAGETGYVLMELIKPPAHQATICDITSDSVKLRTFGADSELGVFSTSVFDKTAYHDVQAHCYDCPEVGSNFTLTVPGLRPMLSRGVLLRTKPCHVKEGGIHAGFGWLDSPCLIDDCVWDQAK